MNRVVMAGMFALFGTGGQLQSDEGPTGSHQEASGPSTVETLAELGALRPV